MAVCDGRMKKKKKKVLYDIAQKLEIDEDRMKEIICNISSEYLRPVGPTTGTNITNFFQ
jgi:hypothetical protein